MLGIPVGELKQRVDSQEFTRWVHYMGIVPCGDEAEQLSTANIMWATFEAAAVKKQGGGRFSPGDFVEDRWEKHDSQTQAQASELSMAKFAMNIQLHNQYLAQRK